MAAARVLACARARARAGVSECGKLEIDTLALPSAPQCIRLDCILRSARIGGAPMHSPVGARAASVNLVNAPRSTLVATLALALHPRSVNR